MIQLVANLTRTNRRKLHVGVDFEWSDKCWTHNLFRAIDLLIGKKTNVDENGWWDDIKPSVASWHVGSKQYQVGYTFEAQLAIFEGYIRAFFKRLSPKLVLLPQAQLAGMTHGGFTPFMFAIAFDAQSATTGTSSVTTLSHTCTGSNLYLFVEILDNTGTEPSVAMTYNSVSMTKQSGVQYPSDRWTHSFTLASPSTGANNIVSSGITYSQMAGISYTGCQSSTTPDSKNTSSAVGTPWTISTTVVASNCWITCGVYGMDPGPYTLSSGSVRGTNTSVALVSGDSNATVGTGSQTLSWNGNTAGRTAVGCIVSIAPAAGAVASQNSDIIFFN